MDLFGFLVIGIVSGLGGGVLRDTLLQHGTPVALTDYTCRAVATGGTLLAFVADLSHHTSGWAFNLLDALALSVWAAAGAQKTLAVGLGRLPGRTAGHGHGGRRGRDPGPAADSYPRVRIASLRPRLKIALCNMGGGLRHDSSFRGTDSRGAMPPSHAALPHTIGPRTHFRRCPMPTTGRVGPARRRSGASTAALRGGGR